MKKPVDPRDRWPTGFLEEGEQVPESATLAKLREWHFNRDMEFEQRVPPEVAAHRAKVQAEQGQAAPKREMEELRLSDPVDAFEALAATAAAQAADAAVAGVTSAEQDAEPEWETVGTDVPPGRVLSDSARERADQGARFDLLPDRGPGDTYEPTDLNPYQPKQEKVYTYRRPKLLSPLDQPGMQQEISFRNVALLSRFISDSGRILPRRRTGVTAKQQRQLARAIRRARAVGYLPFTHKHPKFRDAVVRPRYVTQY